MTVKEFKSIISELPSEFDHFEVVLSRDPEGNGFESLYDVCSTCNGQIQYFDESSLELIQFNDDDFEDLDDYKNHVKIFNQLKPCIVFWP